MRIPEFKHYLFIIFLFLNITSNNSPANTSTHLDFSQPEISTKILMHTETHSTFENYIIKFKKNTSRAISSQVITETMTQAFPGVRVQKLYQHVFDGFMATLTQDHVLQLAKHPNIEFIEQDAAVHLNQIESLTPSWGLDRIDQANLPLDQMYHYTLTGQKVNVYIVDTGLLSTHNEFTGRAGNGYSVVNDGRGTTDCNGHGTHVAGTIAGTIYGIAKQAQLHPVRVLDCSGNGTMSDVIAGLDWVQSNAVHPAVANMSLGGSASAAIDAAVQGVMQSGVTVVVAAGNNSEDACLESPSRAPSVISVGSIASDDSRAYYSNYGTCVALFAPGSDIISSWIGSNNGSNTISGTSMASPHVTGVTALYLGAHPTATPQQVRDALIKNTVQNVLSDVTGSPNLLVQAFQNLTSDPHPTPTPTVTPEPTPTITPIPPTPIAPCTQCTRYDGYLTEDALSYEPNNSYYISHGGWQKFWLTSSTDTIFSIELLKWAGSRWILVARAAADSNHQYMRYYGRSGYYTIRVTALHGEGQYALWIQ